MPRTRSLAWAELKIGLLSIAAIVVAAVLIFAISGSGGFSWQRYPLKAVFSNIAGLNEGSQVRIAGVPVGAVTGIEFAGERVEVLLEIRDEMRQRVTTMSTATLGSVSLLGESAVDITPSTQGAPIPEWGYIRTVPASGSLADVATQATEGIEQLTALLTDIRAGRGTIGQIFTNDALYRDIDGLVVAAEQVARSISAGRGTLGRLVNDPAAARALEASLQNLEAVTAGIRKGEGSLGRFFTDDTLARNLNTMSANVDAITGKISRGEGSAGAFINEREFYDRLNSMSGRLDSVMASLQKAEGTAGLVLHDRQLYENMNAAVVEVRKLVAAITADPRRYLNVRVSLF
jgi:phospholipid/cholesterol/gamma-HCH transport system substrate-binding protein